MKCYTKTLAHWKNPVITSTLLLFLFHYFYLLIMLHCTCSEGKTTVYIILLIHVIYVVFKIT